MNVIKLDFKKDWRQLRLYKITYRFLKPDAYPPGNDYQVRYFLDFQIMGAIKQCEYVYTQGDKKYVEIQTIEELGSCESVHLLI
jgi:hypothetical protein